jgi:hypothetical protein
MKISLDYFAFTTITRIYLNLTNDFPNPALSFCASFLNLLDRSDHAKSGIRPTYNWSLSVLQEEYQKFTIEEIFRLTPDPKQIIKGCQYRYHDYSLTNFNSTDCYKLFNVLKYISGPDICYSFITRKRNSHFSCKKIPKSPLSPFEMYSITLMEQFLCVNEAKLISFIILGEETPPSVSDRFASLIYRLDEESPNKSKANYAFIFGDLYVIQKLPGPYDTRCTHNPGDDEYSCTKKCNNDVYTPYRLASPTDVILEPSNLRPFLVAQKDNVSLIQEIETKLENCGKDCHKPLCFDWYSVSKSMLMPIKRLNSISIASTCPHHPTTQIVFIPKITIIDYIVYLSGCYGIWFGFSVFSLNPFSRKKVARSNTIPQFSVPFQLHRNQIRNMWLHQKQMKTGGKFEHCFHWCKR